MKKLFAVVLSALFMFSCSPPVAEADFWDQLWLAVNGGARRAAGKTGGTYVPTNSGAPDSGGSGTRTLRTSEETTKTPGKKPR